MKKIIFTSVLALVVVFSTQAQERNQRMRGMQDDRSAEEIAKSRTERLDKTLKFTEAQKEKVYALELEKAERFKENRKENKRNREDWRKQAENDRQALEKILTDEQKEIIKESRMSNRRGRHMQRGAKDTKKENMRQRNRSEKH